MTSAPLNCRELVELVTDYLETALSPAERARFEAHLAECPYCVLYLQQMQATIRATGTLPQGALSPEALQRLLHVFERWKAEPR